MSTILDIINSKTSLCCDWTTAIRKKKDEMLNELMLELKESKSKSMYADCYADKVLKIPNSVHTSFYEVWLVEGKFIQFYKANGDMLPACLLSADEIAIILELIKRKKYNEWLDGEVSAIL